MTPPQDAKPPEVAARFSDRMKRRKHRQDTSAFLWGTWLMLLLAIFLGHDTLQGFRAGEWVDLSSDDSGMSVPWWLAAAVTLAVALVSLWCFGQYLKLKHTAPTYLPGDEDADA